MSEVIHVGVDDGYAETKIIMPDGKKFVMPSRTVAGKLNQINILGDEIKTFEYTTPEGSFLVGDIDRADPTNFDQYPLSAQNRVVVNHALIQAGLSGKTIKMCTGLPVKAFYRGTKTNSEMIKSKRSNLLSGEVKSENGLELAIISEHDIISEGIASWVDLVVDRRDGNLSPNPGLVKQRIAIIDVGGRTTDIAVIRDWQLDISRSSTIEAGMLKVYEIIRDRIYEDHGVDPEDSEVMRASKRGVMKLWGKDYQVREIVNKAKEVAVSHMKSEVMRRLGNASDIDRVYFVGGGAISFGDLLSDWFPHQQIAHDPAFCNARGMQKYADLVLSD